MCGISTRTHKYIQGLGTVIAYLISILLLFSIHTFNLVTEICLFLLISTVTLRPMRPRRCLQMGHTFLVCFHFQWYTCLHCEDMTGLAFAGKGGWRWGRMVSLCEFLSITQETKQSFCKILLFSQNHDSSFVCWYRQGYKKAYVCQ